MGEKLGNYVQRFNAYRGPRRRGVFIEALQEIEQLRKAMGYQKASMKKAWADRDNAKDKLKDAARGQNAEARIRRKAQKEVNKQKQAIQKLESEANEHALLIRRLENILIQDVPHSVEQLARELVEKKNELYSRAMGVDGFECRLKYEIKKAQREHQETFNEKHLLEKEIAILKNREQMLLETAHNLSTVVKK